MPALVLGVLGSASLAPALRAIAAHAPRIDFAPRDTIALPLAVAFSAFALMTVLPTAPRRGRGSPAVAGGRAATVCLWVAAAALLATPVTPAIARVIVQAMLAVDYRDCPPDDSVRYASLRWVRSPAACLSPVP